MTQLIQSSPGGILDLLGINLGTHPKVVEDAVQITVDLERYYLARKMEQVDNVATLISVAGDGIVVPVPQGEIWAVHQMGVRLQDSTVVGAELQAHLQVRFNPAGSPVPVAESQIRTTASITERVEVGAHFDSPWLLYPGGSIIGILALPINVGTVGMRLPILVTRLRV